MQKPFKEFFPFSSQPVPVRAGWSRGRLPLFPLHYHPEYEFHFIKCGRGAYYIEGKTWRFKARNLVIIRPNQIHSFIPESNGWIEKNLLLFRGEWLGDVLCSLNIDETFPSLIRLPDFPAVHIEMILNKIVEESLRREKCWKEMIRELLHEFLFWVIRVKDQSVNPQEEKPLFIQLRHYVESHFADPQYNVSLIAKKMGYSLSYLSALFQEASGIGIKQYLLQYRIIAARKILEGSAGLKIEVIARQVGFSQYRSFTRTFIALTGVSPNGYRKNCHIHNEK